MEHEILQMEFLLILLNAMISPQREGSKEVEWRIPEVPLSIILFPFEAEKKISMPFIV